MTATANNQILKIADLAIKLWSNNSVKIDIETGYKQFVVDNDYGNIAIEIEVITPIPLELKNDDNMVFETNDDGKRLWHVCTFEDGYKVIVFNPLNTDEIQQVAIISLQTKQWKIYAEQHSNTVIPLAYPMGPLIMYYLTVSNNAIMIHSSGIIDGNKGRLFSGFSGVGKSTMAQIWNDNGNTIINDDRLFLTIQNDRICMHNSPMFYDDKPKMHELNAIYLLKQTKENDIRRLTDAEAISRLLAFCIQHGYDKQFLEHHLNMVFDIYNKIPIYELGFKPDAEIIDFIRTHE
jgi:hypothetical protein